MSKYNEGFKACNDLYRDAFNQAVAHVDSAKSTEGLLEAFNMLIASSHEITRLAKGEV